MDLVRDKQGSGIQMDVCYLNASMSVFAFLPVVFYKNEFVFLDQVVFDKNVLLYFIKLYLRVSTPTKTFVVFNP